MSIVGVVQIRKIWQKRVYGEPCTLFFQQEGSQRSILLIINALLMAKYGDVVLYLENGAVKEGD